MTPTRTDRIMEGAKIGDKFEATVNSSGQQIREVTIRSIDGESWHTDDGYIRDVNGDAWGGVAHICSRIIRKVTK